MSGSCCSGIHRSGGSPRNVSPKNPGGVTPTTVNGWPSTTSVAPTIDGSAPYVLCHTWWLNTATGGAAGASSVALNTRPPNARTPRVEKYVPVTYCDRSGLEVDSTFCRLTLRRGPPAWNAVTSSNSGSSAFSRS